jgi:hypothetical protein
MTDAARAFAETLSRLPVYRGFSWRAGAFELTMPFTSDAPIPTTRDLRVATENFRVPGVHLFLCTGARDIALFSARPAEQEVVLVPGARLVPASALHEVGGLRVQVVIEQPPQGEPVPAVPTDTEIEALVKTARAAADVQIASPGRFGA